MSGMNMGVTVANFSELGWLWVCGSRFSRHMRGSVAACQAKPHFCGSDEPEALMKGTILDFLKLASEKPDLGKELIELAEKYDITFTDEVSDEELDAVTGPYRLIRILRTEACTGPHGPADLAWVWPLATMVLLPLVMFRRGRRRS